MTRRWTNVPFFDLVNFHVVEETERRSVCEIDVAPWLAELTVVGSPAALLAAVDAGFGVSINTVTPPDHLPVSTGLHVDVIEPLDRAPARLRTESAVVGLRHGVSLVQGTVEATGKKVAVASMRSMLVPIRVATVEPASAPFPEAPPPRAGVMESPSARLPSDVLGVGFARACGAEVVASDQWGATVRLAPPPEIGRSLGAVHGGGVAMLAALALAVVVQRVAGERPTDRLDAHLDFLRPVPLRGVLLARVNVVHRSNRLIIATTELKTDDGRLLARLTETVLVGQSAPDDDATTD